MTMAQNNRIDWFNPDGRNGKESFEEHNESMRRFRKSHANALEHNAPRRDSFREHNQRIGMFSKSHLVFEAGASWRPTLDMLKITRPLHVAALTKEMGGSRHHVSAEKWPALAPIRKVVLPGGSQN